MANEGCHAYGIYGFLFVIGYRYNMPNGIGIGIVSMAFGLIIKGDTVKLANGHVNALTT